MLRRFSFDYPSLGFGLCWGIQLVLLFSRTLFGLHERGADLFNYAMGISLALTAIALFVAARVAPDHFDSSKRSYFRVMVLMYGFFLTLGAVVILATLFVSEQRALQVVGGIFSGMGLCIGYVIWTQMLACHNADKIQLALSVSLGGGIVFFVLLAWAVPVIRIICIVAAAIASCVLGLRYAESIEEPEAIPQPDSADAKLDNLATCAAVFTVGFAYGASGFLSLNSPSAIQQNTIVWHLVLLVASFMLFVAITQLLPRKASVSLLFQLIFPLVVVVMGILPFAPTWYWDIYNFILAGSFQLAEMLLFFSFATSVVREAHFKTSCLPLAGMWLGINAGLFFGSWIFGNDFDIFFILSALVIAIFCAFSITMFILAFVWRQRALGKTRTMQAAEDEATSAGLPLSAANSVVGAMPNQSSFLDLQRKIALDYGLTEREAEIMGYLAKGRSSTFISEKLYLSPNTVRGYIRTAYAKLDVHSKQEVIDLFEKELAR